jgi:RNA polymerase sigma-70 factor (ECF subfamily)
MADATTPTQQIQLWIDRLQAGDDQARSQLINCACERLTALTRKMLRGYTRVRRWEETVDVLQNASLRLYRTLEQVKPASVAEFYRLAALNIRRELLDLAKHYYGKQGQGTHHHSIGVRSDEMESTDDPLAAAPGGAEPSQEAAWTEFHEQIDTLPTEEREVFDLLWYQGLSQEEAGQVLGVNERTIKRRWRSAKMRLYEKLHGELPEP